MRESLKESLKELTALASGESNEIEVRSYNLTESPSYTGKTKLKTFVVKLVFQEQVLLIF
ncbi:hypothetical protein TMUPMC115_2546 [Tetragenococcus muriaticus PMC-11-5]|uniref:Uncharacterized protein n=1 Tax=Tetragenococcus muriaticus PMC-11-5 TaxID=1302649 RepID=A0A091BX08_9ENTE|nr:hypothetical protein TMUPMC115_2546 [Tetragenococcus muriaticus PMC-11-5]